MNVFDWKNVCTTFTCDLSTLNWEACTGLLLPFMKYCAVDVVLSWKNPRTLTATPVAGCVNGMNIRANDVRALYSERHPIVRRGSHCVAPTRD